LFGAVKDSWDWHSREELEAGEESQEGRPHQNRSRQNNKKVFFFLAASNDALCIDLSLREVSCGMTPILPP